MGKFQQILESKQNAGGRRNHLVNIQICSVQVKFLGIR